MVCDQHAHAATCEPVFQVGSGQQGRRRADHRSQLDVGQRQFPQRHDVGQHHEDAVATPDIRTEHVVGYAFRARADSTPSSSTMRSAMRLLPRAIPSK